MDEPTAVLAPHEIDELFTTLRAMTAAGRSVVFISHKLGEVLAIADRITVMRRGQVTAAGIPAAGATMDDLARLMVGRTVLDRIHRTEREPGDVVLEVQDAEADNDRGLPALRGASLQVERARSWGSQPSPATGRRELAEVAPGSGHAAGASGSRRRARQPLAWRGDPPWRPRTSRGPHLGGLRAEPVAGRQLDHEALPRPPIARGSFIDGPAARSLAERLKDGYQISAPSVDSEARLLSGGNLQLLILARELETSPQLLVAVQPTRGLDVGAIERVHQLLLDLRGAGAAILLISEELDELFALADRIDVMYEGRIAGSFPPDPELIHASGCG